MHANPVKGYFGGMPRPTLFLPAFVFMLCGVESAAQISNPHVHLDPMEVRMPATWMEPQEQVQRFLRSGPFWSGYLEEHPRWQVQFHPATHTVHRAFGPAVQVEEPVSWLMAQVQAAGWAVQPLEWKSTAMGKHTLYRAQQQVEGRPVIGTEFVVKVAEQGVVMWGAQCFPSAVWPEEECALSGEAIVEAALDNLSLAGTSAQLGNEAVMPLRTAAVGSGETTSWVYRPVRRVRVSGTSSAGIPVIYDTWVDLGNGTVLDRQNMVRHLGQSGAAAPRRKTRPMGPASWVQMMNCQVTGTAHLTQPFEAPVEVGLDHLVVQTASGLANTAAGGLLTLDDGVQTVGLQLAGLWSTVTTNGVTPSFNVEVASDTTLVFDGAANIREMSAYHNVNRIHDHVQAWLPGFTGMDFSLPTIVDVSGTCNAFYTPGNPSINFYSEGDGCNAFSLVADVVFHEYGHGINDLYYESLGSTFINGAMGEGYADLWAISLTDNPILGAGCYMDNADFYIRRYDEDPKVYPLDLVGEVHADGEIICGAWYDTHLLMGGDWGNSMPLFIEAYAGQQATIQNGNEGQAFVEVLLDALQADDDNADLSDGTPNGAAILEGFGIHGITLFSNVDIGHDAIEQIAAEVPLTIAADALVLFPFSQYFGSCDLFYRTSPFDAWTSVVMEQVGGSDFTATIPSQEEGTVIEYHFGITDIYGFVSAVKPYSANDAENPNLPYNTIVGLEPVLIDDQDDYSQFGFWDIGLPEDNATTGQWESTIPVGSYSNPGDPTSICAPAQDHTPGDGLFAFITGVSPGADAGIGANDVDAGSTTLQSQAIDLSGLVAPVLSYWRWYVNAPASGANPGADWWQVHVSSDGGENWVEIEETLTQDISWRRNAFAVQEYVPLTDAFKIRFTASDSLRPDQGLEFDGGSLIEAAVDDLVLHDVAISHVEEGRNDLGIVAWPIPFAGRIHATGWRPGTSVMLVDIKGVATIQGQADANGAVHLDAARGADGTYILVGTGRDGRPRSKEVIRMRE